MNPLQLIADVVLIVCVPLLIWKMIDLRRAIRDYIREMGGDACVTVSADKHHANGDKNVAKTRQEMK